MILFERLKITWNKVIEFKNSIPPLKSPFADKLNKFNKLLAFKIVLIGSLVIAVALGATYYYDLPPGTQIAEFINSQSENKAELLDVVAIADFSGPTRMIGQDLAQGFKDAAAAGNILNDVRLVIRDDRGNANAVAALADGAASGFSTLAVIGPTQASGYQDYTSSLEEGMVPGLVPISSPISHRDEKWIFALQPSQQRQAEFVSNLLLKAKLANSIVFISYEGDNTNGYAAGFQKVYGKNSSDKFSLKTWPKNADAAKVSELVKAVSAYSYVAFSLPTADAIELVKALKDSGYSGQLIGFGGASLPTFPSQFEKFPKEQLAPGYYTNGLMSVTPFLPSMADEHARELIGTYQKKNRSDPSWAYAYGYDSGYLLSNFIEKLKMETPEWKKLPPEELRKNFQTYLLSLNSNSVKAGAFTGQIRLDQNHERDVPPTLVAFKNGKQIPYMLQYGTDAARFNFTDKVADNQIQLENKVYDLVPIIFTGLIPKEISFINLEKRTFTAEMDIWFRGSQAIDADDIFFPALFTDNPSFTVLESSDTKYEKYRLFRYRGVFKFEALAKDLALGQLPLSVAFRHKSLDSSKLRFVIDEVNTGNSASIIKHMNKAEVLAPEMDYRAEGVSFAIENDLVNSLGNPVADSGERNFSEFKAAYSLRKKDVLLSSYVGSKMDWRISFAIAALFALCALFPKICSSLFVERKKLSRLITLECAFMAVFFSEVGLFFSPILDKTNSVLLLTLQNAFSACYYFAIAATLNLIISWAIDKQKSKKTAIQGSLKILVSSLIYSTFFGFYYTDVLNRDILPVLAASSVILTVVGLALRELILDALGGITIGLEGAIKPGDWVHINAKDHNIDGMVEELGWRNVRIHSRDGLVHFIPNSILIQQTVSNASSNGGYERLEIPFEISPRANLKQINEMITFALADLLGNNPFVDHSRPIRIVCEEIESRGVEMHVQVFYRSDQSADQLSTIVLELVNRVLHEHNALPFMAVEFSGQPSDVHSSFA
ncbi:ABC transporter substrate-binding protein [Polynucleobacter sp. MWH-Svant-W18]|uniref:ABC transporter substrate-binding protein n=1 Tax=Polynucleobacter sp. MWH-Svant-W18 TaxID=1855909 RepID=UPI001BFD15F6|nr:ABC transporter substrate-binding protein [Polynucleobacter sp. MWH-Svant-W18]QWD77222.1 mechanosensitive ion channel [Polynucleobacter sp. MWH-Svant-W18]